MYLFIHASDYKPVYMAGFEEVLLASSDLTEFEYSLESNTSSADDYQVLFLKKNPQNYQQGQGMESQYSIDWL